MRETLFFSIMGEGGQWEIGGIEEESGGGGRREMKYRYCPLLTRERGEDGEIGDKSRLWREISEGGRSKRMSIHYCLVQVGGREHEGDRG